MKGDHVVGSFTGTGADYNLELGFIPSWFRAVNITDGDVAWEWFKGMTDGYAFKAGNHAATQFSTETSNGISAFAGEAPGKVLTGTVSKTADSTALTGDGTSFLTELKAGDEIVIDEENLKIASVTDATNAVLAEAAAYTDAGALCTRKTGRSPGLTIDATVNESKKVLRYVALR